LIKKPAGQENWYQKENIQKSVKKGEKSKEPRENR